MTALDNLRCITDAPLRKIPSYQYSRALLRYPWEATREQLYRFGELLCHAHGARRWLYGIRFGMWCWIQIVTKTGKYIGGSRG